MGEYLATVRWQRGDQKFSDNRYSRAHEWEFDGGVVVPGSPSPHVVPEPLSDPSAVDPEEAFVAAISSCHMLTFLSIAAKRRHVVDRYVDRAVGVLEKNEAGREAVTKVTLNPQIQFSGEQPSQAELQKLHEMAHQLCFIANSVKSEIVVCDGS